MNINDIRQAAFRGNEEDTPENKFLEGAAEWASDYFGTRVEDEFLSNIQQRAFGGQGVEEYANLSRPTEFDSSSFAPMESLEDEFIGPDFTEYQHGQVNQTDYTGAVYPGYDDARHDWHWVQENVPESEWVNWGPTEGDKTLDQLTSEDWEAGHHDLTLQQKEQTSGFISEAQASDANDGEGKWHVQKGDTLTSIANTLGTSVPALLKANPDIKDKNNISVGQKLNMYGPNMVESEGGEEYGDINKIKDEGNNGSVKASGDTPTPKHLISTSHDNIVRLQENLGVTKSGLWDAKTQTAFEKTLNAEKGRQPDARTQTKALQTIVGATVDGEWGGGSDKAFYKYRDAGRGESTDLEQLASEIEIPLEVTEKLVKVESSDYGYTADNRNSSAFGKYQFMTDGIKSTGFVYAVAQGYNKDWGAGEPLRDWMRENPKAQDKMFVELTRDNIGGLKRNGITNPTAIDIYGAHQQGVTGYLMILRQESQKALVLSDEVTRNLRNNLFEDDQGLSGQALAKRWLEHYRNKVN
jgi:LysM repeat protein